MTPSLPRRRLLAAAVPGLLAGCLVESSEETGGSGDETGTSAGDGASDSESEAGDDGDSESVSEGGDPAAEQTEDEDPPEAVGPDGSGLVVTDVDVLGVTDGGYETTVRARLTVENAGRFTYGAIELRADAYAVRPNSSDREAVGDAYVTRRFTSDDRFADGTERFAVEISFRSRETNARPDPDWYEVDAAVRRAEPV
ncbi:hypothetical protein [Halorubrum lipolyticum]|uniref:Uncharacterized protein n=1 Tax=Halorubrum lipolyticum DSM 21995 TaxID=1227482 RepID=M0NMV9_9EURY|nr:hypothetical protein [Halorubrum lipolyticum]EMA59131.1 hypothetical protein C469_10891 [Halorubrum lipolyticum DSM 21995]